MYFGGPFAIATDSTGNVYVGGYEDSTLRVINTLGEVHCDAKLLVS